jgi:hypothetical protein
MDVANPRAAERTARGRSKSPVARQQDRIVERFRQRQVGQALRALERFPLMGPALTGRWEGFRFVLGPWRWLLLVYVFIEREDRVVVVTIQDARSSTAATTTRG